MTRSPLRTGLLGAVAALALVAAGCGGSDNKKASSGGGAPIAGKPGGTLKVLSNGDVDYIDAGAAYYQFSYMVTSATQRPLYSYKPDEPLKPAPDLASADPEISADAKTVTVKLKSGIKFSPPVSREVTSKDVKYAIERGFNSNVANGYAGAYFGNITGVKAYQDKKAKEISGIETPDDQTIVFKLDKPTGGVVAQALVLPLSAPVPPEYAKPFDAKNPSTYGVHQVATGPYQVEADSSGKLTGYQPGKRIVLVRNPSWDKSTDFRPAYLDKIDIQEGVDPNVGSRQIIEGQSLVNGDFAPPPEIIKSALASKKDQVALVPSGGNRYVSMNTKIKPFDNVDVRRAVLAVFDRNAMRLTRGGEALGGLANHFIPPGIPGFEEAGGEKGPGFDFLANPSGDLKLAQEYMKKAGYPSGKYTGSEKLLMVGSTAAVAKKSAEVAQAQFQKLGFKLNFRLVTPDSMYTKFCNVPKAAVAICPNVGWLKDFNDAQTILDPTFNGKNIVPVNNSNWPQFDDPEINAAMDKAEEIVDAGERAKAWGEIDKMLTEKAAAVPWIWDNQPNIRSANVNGVIAEWNATYDFAFSSLK